MQDIFRNFYNIRLSRMCDYSEGEKILLIKCSHPSIKLLQKFGWLADVLLDENLTKFTSNSPTLHQSESLY